MMTWIARVSFTKLLEKIYFKVIKDTGTQIRELIHFWRRYCIFMRLKVL